jgi:hypothetical protein
MRRLIPLLLISLVALLSLAAVFVSLSDSTPIAFFSQPKPGSPTVVRTFYNDVKATLDAPSFLLFEGGIVGAIEYQAPNRTMDLSKPDEVIVIGKTSYQKIDSTQWGEGPLTPEIDNLFGPHSVRFALRQLIGLKGVKRTAGGFIARQVVAAATFSPGSDGQALVLWTVGIRNGFVVSFNETVHGIFSSYEYAKATPFFSPMTVKELRSEPGTFSRFGKIPQITAPPKSKTVKLIACKNGDSAYFGFDRYVCGTFGT